MLTWPLLQPATRMCEAFGENLKQDISQGDSNTILKKLAEIR